MQALKVCVLLSTPGTLEQASLSAVFGAGDQPSQPFSCIAINLASGMNTKITVKVWAKEYIDFGALQSVTPLCKKEALSMVSGGGAANYPQLTLEPCHTPKKVTNGGSQQQVYFFLFCNK